MKTTKGNLGDRQEGRTADRPSYPSVNFRLGDLGSSVFERGQPNHVVKRDLQRYYSLLTKVLPRFERTEAIFLLLALHDLGGDVASVIFGRLNLLWAYVHGLRDFADVEDPEDILYGPRGRRLGRGRAPKYEAEVKQLFADLKNQKISEVVEQLVERLRTLDPCQALAVVDAVERAWMKAEEDDLTLAEASERVGLVHHSAHPSASDEEEEGAEQERGEQKGRRPRLRRK